MLRIGVTGHRALVDPDRAARDVDAALDRLLAGDRHPQVVSALAEGADRIVAERILERPGATLVAVLPLDADEYEDDFADDRSRRQFRHLLSAADSVTVTGRGDDGSRVSAYERAGHAVVDGSDVVLALWDGEPGRGRGGTAEIVAYARDRGVDVEVVAVEQGPR